MFRLSINNTHKMNGTKVIKFVEKFGFFRLTLFPLGLAIIISALVNGIWGMGIVGAIVMIFGALNKCLLMGQCDINKRYKKSKSSRD